MNLQYFIPTRLVFGSGKIKTLHELELPGKRALIVISAGKSTRENGYLDTVCGELDAAGVSYVIFDKILSNPVKSHVTEGARLAAEQGCDFVLGLGGGSSIDSAKAIARMATNDGDYWDYISGGSGGGKTAPVKPLPIVAIPTTAGTGTEADQWMVVTKEETNEKIGSGDDGTFPTLSVIDPELMLSVPPALTAYQGFDALFHSMEGFISRRANVISDAYALKAIELIAKNLPAAVADGGNLAAREAVAMGSMLSGMVEAISGCTSEHSLEHALSAYHHDLQHGAGLIMISREYYLHFARAGAAKERMAMMGRAMGNADASCGMCFVSALSELQGKCGVDKLKMSDYGIKKDELRKYAQNAKATMGGLFENDPAELSEDGCVAILENSYR